MNGMTVEKLWKIAVRQFEEGEMSLTDFITITKWVNKFRAKKTKKK